MKSIARILAILMTVSLLGGCGTGAVEQPSDNKTEKVTSDAAFTPVRQRDGQYIIAENDGRALLLDQDTLRLGLMDMASGRAVYSNPEATAIESDVDDAVKNSILSQVEITYYTMAQKVYTLSSYDSCVLKGQYALHTIENGVRIEYTLGEEETIDILPDAVSRQTMEEVIFPALDDSDRSTIEKYYVLHEYDALDEEYAGEIQTLYANFGDTDLYILKYVAEKRKNQIRSILKEAGFTGDMLVAEYETIGYDVTPEVSPNFYIPVEYTLEQGKLSVRVPCDEIAFSKDEFFLTEIRVLPFFGCSPKAEDGYMFLPDGSGILIDLDNANTDALSVDVYSAELNQNVEDLTELSKEDCSLPVYGIKREDTAFLAILEEGEALATLVATPYRNTTKLNYVAVGYRLQERISYKPGGVVAGSEFVRYGAENYQGDIRIRFHLLLDEDADYVGMALLYRDYLFGDDTGRSTTDRIVLDTYGVIRCEEDLFNFTVTKNKAMTTLSQLQTVLETIGSDDLLVRYNNFTGDEYYNAITVTQQPAGVLGSQSDLEALLAYTDSRGIEVYPAYQLLFAGKDTWTDDFNRKKQAVLTTENSYGTNLYDHFDDTKYRYIVNSGGLTSLFAKLRQVFVDTPFAGVALSDMGSCLATDYSKKNYQSREVYKSAVISGLETVSDTLPVIVSGANAYTLPYISLATEVPYYGSSYPLQDEEVPFLQIVLSGQVGHCGEAINLSDDPQTCFLKTVETGAQLHFAINYGEAQQLKHSEYSHLFRTNYLEIAEDINTMSARYEAYKAQVADAVIIDYAVVGEVTFTYYDNGCCVAVNYGDTVYTHNGQKIGARDFLVIGG